MNTNDFISRWGAVVKQERLRAEAEGVPEIADDLLLITSPPTILDVPSFPLDAARFLTAAGLPGSCSPFLSFEAVGRGPLPLLQYYGAHQFRSSDSSRLASFYVLGSDSAGNPLCLDTACDGEIVMLDHEDRFQTRTFVASSVASLAQALLVIHTTPPADFISHLERFDPRAAEPSAFLPMEVSMLDDGHEAGDAL
jgi:hypothetical protein